jgi:hypothetical protein
MGRGTYTDIPRHVAAATRILKMRLFNRPSILISKPFDRLAVESVMYQIFLVTTGLWTENFGKHYQFDPAFWIRAEKLLDRSTLFPDASKWTNSPVMGVPVALFRLMLSLKKQYQDPLEPDDESLESIREEVDAWEVGLLCDNVHRFNNGEKANRKQLYYRDATHLYILIASLLSGQLSMATRRLDPGPAAQNAWQVSRAMEILENHQCDGEWNACYIGNWPVYTLGFFVKTKKERQIVEGDMRRRWELTKFAQTDRFLRDLEETWRQRKLVDI